MPGGGSGSDVWAASATMTATAVAASSHVGATKVRSAPAVESSTRTPSGTSMTRTFTGRAGPPSRAAMRASTSPAVGQLAGASQISAGAAGCAPARPATRIATTTPTRFAVMTMRGGRRRVTSRVIPPTRADYALRSLQSPKDR